MFPVWVSPNVLIGVRYYFLSIVCYVCRRKIQGFGFEEKSGYGSREEEIQQNHITTTQVSFHVSNSVYVH